MLFRVVLLSTLTLASFAAVSCAAERAPAAAEVIRVDQVGYPVHGSKAAVVVSAAPLKTFGIHRVSDGERIFAGQLSAPVSSRDSGERVQIADFSPVTKPGRYVVHVAGIGASAPFDVGETPYGPLLRLAMRSYYGQRCGTAVDLGPEQKGFSHAACHLEGAYHASSGRSGKRGPTRGWHDAGDYGRYVVNSGITTGTLLWAWELYPDSLRAIDLAIPESRNDTPDVLDEIRWNLDWMMTMQDADGGVWHKQSSEDFPRFILPEKDHLPNYVIGTGSAPFKSSCATADFAAAMAIAARVYRPYDPEFAQQALASATRAWNWVSAHPDVAFRNAPGVTGGYDDEGDCRDERLWAAAELWRTSGDASADQYFLANAGEALAAVKADGPPDWKNVGALAAWTYALDGKGDQTTVDAIRKRSLASADAVASRAAVHGYRIPMLTADYVWGSNAVAANYALQLLVANAMKPDARYVDSATEVVHYLLGRNPFSLSWVTGSGTRSVLHPHHRPSGSDGVNAPWPGLLAGGPNRNRQDPAMRRLPKNLPPARMYVDAQGSYASNEVAINWNAPLVFVLAGIQAAER